MRKRFIYKILGALLLLPLLSGCNDSDDLQAIFIGKTWKLTYINVKDQYGMMDGFTKESLKIFQDSKDAYFINFSGVEESNKISGNIAGKVITAGINGTWSADGKNNQFKADIQNINESDGLAKAFITGLTNASSYSGDMNNLFLYYKPSGSEQTFVLAFHVLKGN